MNERDKLIADMYTWIFRYCEKKWNKSPKETGEIFKQGNIYNYISECYDLLCCSSYILVVEDVEAILLNKGIKYE